MDFKQLIKSFENCSCGEKHECGIRDICIGSGFVNEVGNILHRNNFPKKILLVADKTTFEVASPIVESLKDFEIKYLIYDSKRVATMDDVRNIEKYLDEGIEGIVAVGTGSIQDPCRLACANKQKPLCLFATAPSMDGFASYSAPIVDNNFKATHPAKCPDVIIADTKILAESPAELKSAGFGDMVGKYIALIDWRVSHLISGESYCEKVAGLTRFAVDSVMDMAERITCTDEESAKMLFEGLLLTGIAMSFVKTSRPASGAEHLMAHYMECQELLNGETPDFHGVDVGICTLIILKLYETLLDVENIKAFKEWNDWEAIVMVYGDMAQEMLKLNMPNSIMDDIEPHSLEDNWDNIKKIIADIPSYATVKQKMTLAGCKISYEQSNKTKNFIKTAFIFHPYMRRRLSLRRLLNMTNINMRDFINKYLGDE